MRRLITNRMSEGSGIDDESWAMGVLEPILLILAIAIIGVLVNLL